MWAALRGHVTGLGVLIVEGADKDAEDDVSYRTNLLLVMKI